MTASWPMHLCFFRTQQDCVKGHLWQALAAALPLHCCGQTDDRPLLEMPEKTTRGFFGAPICQRRRRQSCSWNSIAISATLMLNESIITTWWRKASRQLGSWGWMTCSVQRRTAGIYSCTTALTSRSRSTSQAMLRSPAPCIFWPLENVPSSGFVVRGSPSRSTFLLMRRSTSARGLSGSSPTSTFFWKLWIGGEACPAALRQLFRAEQEQLCSLVFCLAGHEGAPLRSQHQLHARWAY